MAERPLFTVLMPVYNASKYLDEAIWSVRNQTLANFEFLIINDGSTDNSLSIIKKHAAQDARIKVVSRPNKGFVNTLNEGIGAASSDIIARVDADDVCLPDRYEHQYNYLQKNPECAIVGCQLRTIDEDGHEMHIDPRPSSDHNLKLFLGYGCALSGPTVMFRRKLIQAAGGFKIEAWPAEDYECWTRVVRKYPKAKFYNIPDVLYLYRENSEGISLTNKRAQIDKTIEIGDNFRGFMAKRKWRSVSLSSHLAWLHDASMLQDKERAHILRVYYNAQRWYLRDMGRYHPLISKLDNLKLRLYTHIFNRDNANYPSFTIERHEYPKEEQ